MSWQRHKTIWLSRSARLGWSREWRRRRRGFVCALGQQTNANNYLFCSLTLAVRRAACTGGRQWRKASGQWRRRARVLPLGQARKQAALIACRRRQTQFANERNQRWPFVCCWPANQPRRRPLPEPVDGGPLTRRPHESLAPASWIRLNWPEIAYRWPAC